MRPAAWIIVALLLFATWRWYTHREIEHAPGILAADDPEQTDLDDAAPIARGGFSLQPRADFHATVRILHREDYSVGDLATLVPTDFAVGWGPMSDSSVLARIDISQSNRFYFWHTNDWPVSRADIETHSANWHVIPGSDAVRSTLDSLRAGSIVELRGELVDIEGQHGRMKTSLTRGDTGAGACEILLATSARVFDRR